MGLTLPTAHLRRYADIAWLLVKHGRSDLVTKAGLDEAVPVADRAPAAASPEARDLADDLEKMGPTFIKLGQLLSTRADLLPPAYLDALSRLQDRVEPFAFAEVERIVSSELGARMSKAFADFDATPAAAASLGQVHRATMRDGRLVAVKVQRPGIRELVVDDLEVIEHIAELLDRHTDVGRRYQFARMVEEFRASLFRELDYRQEAQNLVTLRDNLAALTYIVVPRPVADYTTSRVLTMEYVRGTKITTLSPVVRLELDRAGLAEQLFRAYLRQILVDGFFHADPHPGNVLVTDDGRIALVDLGMVARVSPRLQDLLLQLLLAIADDRSDDATTYAIQIAEVRADFQEAEFSRRLAGLLGRHQHARLETLDVGRLVMEVARVSAESGLRLPPELTMLGKTLLNLDLVARTLDPSFDPTASIRRHAGEMMRHRLGRSMSLGHLFSGLLEVKDFAERLPGRVNRILDAVASNQLALKVDAIDEATLMAGFQKVANRISLGLVLSALIVGAALLMRVETTFRLWGYPGLAIIFFLLAAAGGVGLAVNIVVHDWRARRKR